MASSNKSLFFQQSESFINELKKILPNDPKIQLFEEKYYMVKRVNATFIINGFVKHVLPYKDKILNKDEQFFIDGGGQENLDADKYEYSLNLKTQWKTFSDSNKAIIWKFFQVLVVLAERYVMEVMKSQINS